MNKRVCVSMATSFVVGLLAPGFVMADNCGGSYSSITESTAGIEVAKNHSINYWTARNTASSENSKFNGIGMCNGYAINTPDGKMRMSGACALKDAKGDSWSYTWGMEPGTERGWWKMTAGTGVFAGTNASGWWQQGASDGKAAMGAWGGTCM